MQELLPLILPTLLGIVLVGGALVGSVLSPKVRRQAEIFVLFPLLLVALLAASGIAVFWEHNWWAASFFAVAGVLSAMRFAKHLRKIETR